MAAIPAGRLASGHSAMKRVSVQLPDDLDARLRDEAQRRGVTIAEITRAALEEHLRGGADRHLDATIPDRSGPSDLAEHIEVIIAAESNRTR
jgi:predicted DNA-binding protein